LDDEHLNDDERDVTAELEAQFMELMARAQLVPMDDLLRPAFAHRFQQCTVCETDLVARMRLYLVFREVRQRETLVELAICVECLDVLEQVYSPSTRQAIDTLFLESGWSERAGERLSASTEDLHAWLETCALTGEPLQPDDHFEVIGLCKGGFMHMSFFPYVIGAAGIARLEEAISKQTQANWDRFLGQHQGLPPELRQLLHLDRPETDSRLGGR
jgi:hypothetical protein